MLVIWSRQSSLTEGIKNTIAKSMKGIYGMVPNNCLFLSMLRSER